MISTPSLRARNTEKHLTWMSVLVPLGAAALTGPDATRQYYARVITLCAITCLDVSSAELVHRNGATTTRYCLTTPSSYSNPQPSSTEPAPAATRNLLIRIGMGLRGLATSQKHCEKYAVYICTSHIRPNLSLRPDCCDHSCSHHRRFVQ